VTAEVFMKVVGFVAFALVLPFVQACSHAPQPTESTSLSRPCLVAAAANAGDDANIAKLQRDLREQRAPARAAEQLGYRFISRARVSNDAGFYTVAEQAAACLESIDPSDASALLLRGHVLHQRHRFAEAETIARRLVAMREFVLDYGLLGDVLMEQGRLADAAVAYQKMIDLKPFYQSYTRAAHLRWLKGDLAGAIALMEKAVKAASPRDPESIAWAYTRLASYELQRGRLSEADRLIASALQHVPNYAAALLVRGRIQLAGDKRIEAVATLETATRLNPLPEYRWTLADALRQVDRMDEATAVETQLLREGADDPRTVALFLSTRRLEHEKAIDLARQELKNRGDVFTLDALAWSLARAGKVSEASALMTRALAEGTEDGRLFLHAAVIAADDGRPADAARWARKARTFRFTLLPSELGVLRAGIVASPRA
jgi:tetratricopeptide (TPR) repeat protein